MRAFEYHRAASIEEACATLSRCGPEARILAGGQSLLNMMKWRIAAPTALVDAKGVASLADVQETKDTIRVGSMVTYGNLGKAVLIKGLPIIHDALDVIADLQVRNLGTLGGSCCQADPFGDMPNVMVALDAILEAKSIRGSRQIPINEFFLGPLETSLETDEMLTSIHIDRSMSTCGSAYEKFSWRKGDYAIVSVASVIGLTPKGKCTVCRLVVGGLGPGPIELKASVKTLLGQIISEGALKEAALAAARECRPEPDSTYGSADYKRLLVETITARSLERSWRRARDLIAGEDNA